MKDFIDFIGGFGDLETMMLDTGLDTYIVRIYDDEGYAITKAVIGYTQLTGDVMLHMLDAEEYDSEDELFESINEQGIEFRLLSKIMESGGIDILPRDQFDGDCCDGDDCCYECCSCDDEPWTCHCGNVNSEEDVFCLKCGCLEGEMEDGCEYKELVEFSNTMREMTEGLKKELGVLGIKFSEPIQADIQKMMKEISSEM